jgi:magnesium transporter
MKSKKTMNLSRITVGQHIRTDMVLFCERALIQDVINDIRKSNISDQITYFYVTDAERCLMGVLPIRRLLSARPEQAVGEVMVKRVLALEETDTLERAAKLFNEQKYLAFPVVDRHNRFLGVLDITVLTGSAITFAENHRFDDVFQTIGIKASIVRYLTPATAFKLRFPWLMPTLLSGIACAVLASFFEQTIAHSIVLAFFMTLALGLGESVSIQTLTITIRRLHIERPSWRWYSQSVVRELGAALLMGCAIGVVLVGIIYLWHGSLMAGVSIGISVALALCSASFFGLSVPTLLHKTRLDPRVAAGPLVLGLTDVCTLLFYFSLARLFLLPSG